MCLPFQEIGILLPITGVIQSTYAFSQWEVVLHCNAISHWLGTYTEMTPEIILIPLADSQAVAHIVVAIDQTTNLKWVL